MVAGAGIFPSCSNANQDQTQFLISSSRTAIILKALILHIAMASATTLQTMSLSRLTGYWQAQGFTVKLAVATTQSAWDAQTYDNITILLSIYCYYHNIIHDLRAWPVSS